MCSVFICKDQVAILEQISDTNRITLQFKIIKIYFIFSMILDSIIWYIIQYTGTTLIRWVIKIGIGSVFKSLHFSFLSSLLLKIKLSLKSSHGLVAAISSLVKYLLFLL